MVIAALGSLFFMVYTHAGQAKHPESAHEEDVIILAVKVGAIESNIENIKEDVEEIRVEQRVHTNAILEAIRNGD